MSTVQKFDHRVGMLIANTYKLLLGMNSYRVLFLTMLFLYGGVRLDPQGEFLVWVQHYSPFLTAPIWEILFLSSALILYQAKPGQLGWRIMILASPLMLLLYLFVQAVRVGFFPQGLFSYVCIGIFGMIVLFYILRTPIVDNLRQENAEQELLIADLKLQLSEALHPTPADATLSPDPVKEN